MTRMSYEQQLLHPKWQRKRLEILEAANFQCRACGNGDKTLHVHHRRYVKGRMAWEYEDRDLEVLCKDCHAQSHQIRDALSRVMGLKFAAEVPVDLFAFGFLVGMLAPFGGVDGGDIELALEHEPRFFGLGYMVAALGPHEITAAVKRKRQEGRLSGENDMLDWLIAQEEGVGS